MMKSDIFHTIQNYWSIDTAHPSYQSKWNKINPSIGQCAATALLVQDEVPDALIYKCKVGRATHYYNKINPAGNVIDLTVEQFGARKIDYDNCQYVARKQLLKCKHVKERYEFLRRKLDGYGYVES